MVRLMFQFCRKDTVARSRSLCLSPCAADVTSLLLRQITYHYLLYDHELLCSVKRSRQPEETAPDLHNGMYGFIQGERGFAGT